MNKILKCENMQRVLILLITLIFVSLPQTGVLAASLIMVEQEGCEYCEAWDADIGGIYNKTAEGKRAPLRRVDIFDPLPEDLKFIKRLFFTPTFVLVDQGKEIGRISGYPGEDFFWGLLQQLIEKLPAKAKLGALQRGLPGDHGTKKRNAL